MARFLKKGPFGRMVDSDDGALDPNLVEVCLRPDEYQNLIQEIKKLENDVNELKAEADEREDAAYQDANEQLKQFKEKIQKDSAAQMQKQSDDAERRVRRAQEAQIQAEKQVTEMSEKLAKQIDLNSGLKRITRERANAKRGISPKKDRSGYIVLLAEQYRQQYRTEISTEEWRAEHPDANETEYRAHESRSVSVWKTTLQTPYDAGLSLEEIREDLWNDLLNKVLYDIGIRKIQSWELNGQYRRWMEKDEIDDSASEVCGLYRWDYRKNFRDGFWELILYQTLEPIVSEEYRKIPTQKK